MEHAKKMIMIPQDMFRKLNQKREEQICSTSDLDSEMKFLLNDNNEADREKWVKYQQMLQRYLRLKEQEKQPLQLTMEEVKDPDSQNLVNNEILDNVPKLYRKRSQLLLQRLVASDVITWDKQGEVTIRGERLVGSNITDLISDVVRPRKTSNPTFWQEFCSLLKELNIPHEFINNPRRLAFLSSGNVQISNSSTTPSTSLSIGKLYTRRKTRSPKGMTLRSRVTPDNQSPRWSNTSWEVYRL